MEWKKIFVLVEAKDTDWRRFSNPRYVYENREYRGGKTVRVESSARKIEKFLQELQEKNLLKYIKRVELNYVVGNEFRGSGSNNSYIYVDKKFANKIKLKGYFRWIDRAWGDYVSDLQYDLNNLSGFES